MHLQGPVPTLGSSALSTSAPHSRGVSAGTYSRWALIHLLLLNLDMRSWESGHLTVLHFCCGGRSRGGSATAPRNTGGVFSGETGGSWASAWGRSLGEGQAPSTPNQL